jgi:crotonobetainyl-CoA:carnitine CoA-transferase CaiB-like acyl-CoA transferase
MRDTTAGSLGFGHSLDGLRVLDLTHVLAGPTCTLVLADLGADIIKIEPPGRGESMRHNPPFYPGGVSHYFLANDRGKRSVAIDLKTEQGRRLALDLVAECDVVVENFRPGVMARMGLSFDELQKVNPSVVMLSISAYGQTGPLAEQPGYDLVTQARTGLMALTGEPDGPPTKFGLPTADLATGLWGAIGVLAALHGRTESSPAQHIDLSLLEGSLALLSAIGQRAMLEGHDPEQLGASHDRFVPYGRYRAQDGHLILTLHQPGAWERFCEAAGASDLANEARFATYEGRLEHRAELEHHLEELLMRRTRVEWEQILAPAGIAFGPVLDVNEALTQPQARAREVLRPVDDPTAGRVEVVGSPLRRAGEAPPAPPGPPPRLGEHTDEVLGEVLGLSRQAVDALVRDNIVARMETAP